MPREWRGPVAGGSAVCQGVPAAAAAEQSPVLAATVHVARHTARPLPKHRAGVGPASLTETSAQGGPPRVHLHSCPPFLLRPFSGHGGGRAQTGWFFLVFSAAFTRWQGESLGTGRKPVGTAQSRPGPARSSAVRPLRKRRCCARASNW